MGDAPPKMNYPDDVKYPVTCERAARAGIIINTVQCGAMVETTKVWQDIAKKSEGRFAQIEQSGGMAVVKTPFDSRMSELSKKLSATAVAYGDTDAREAMRRTLKDAEDDMAEAPGEASAERAGYMAKSGKIARADLLGMLERKSIKLEDVKEDQLPEKLKAMSPEERKAAIDKLLAERKALREELISLDKQRADFVKKELAKRGSSGDAFDDKVLGTLKEQAKKIGVEYE